MPRGIEPRMLSAIVSADWSMKAAKRAVYVADVRARSNHRHPKAGFSELAAWSSGSARGPFQRRAGSEPSCGLPSRARGSSVAPSPAATRSFSGLAVAGTPMPGRSDCIRPGIPNSRVLMNAGGDSRRSFQDSSRADRGSRQKVLRGRHGVVLLRPTFACNRWRPALSRRSTFAFRGARTRGERWVSPPQTRWRSRYDLSPTTRQKPVVAHVRSTNSLVDHEQRVRERQARSASPSDLAQQI